MDGGCKVCKECGELRPVRYSRSRVGAVSSQITAKVVGRRHSHFLMGEEGMKEKRSFGRGTSRICSGA